VKQNTWLNQLTGFGFLHVKIKVPIVGNNDQRLLGRHNVSQSGTSKYRGVTRDVAIAGKDSRKINTSHKDK